MAKVKVLTAQQAIEKYKYYKEEITRILQAQVELKEKLKAKNEEIESLKKQPGGSCTLNLLLNYSIFLIILNILSIILILFQIIIIFHIIHI